MVPLIRMNWRSRPTCSSMRRAASRAVPALDGVRDDRGELRAVPLDGEDDAVGGQAVEAGAQQVVGREPLGEGHELAVEPLAQRAVGVAQRLEQRPPQRVPQRDAGGRELRVVEQPLLEALGPGLGDRRRRAGPGRAGAASSPAPHGRGGRGSSRMSAIQRTASEWIRCGDRLVEPRRRPPGRALAEHLGERVGVLHQPAVQLLQGQVDERRGAGRRGPPRPRRSPATGRSAPPGSGAPGRTRPGRRCGGPAPCPCRSQRRRRPRRPPDGRSRGG